jgi:hypothetical protein
MCVDTSPSDSDAALVDEFSMSLMRMEASVGLFKGAPFEGPFFVICTHVLCNMYHVGHDVAAALWGATV